MAQIDVNDLTPEQLSEYKKSRTSYFKGTITVAVIYGTLALVMFLVAVFSSSGRSIITDTMLPFTITFISGMIIVVILMLIAIFAMKPPAPRVFAYDSSKCPDFWSLQATPQSFLNSFSGIEAAQMRYRCVNPAATNLNTLSDPAITTTNADIQTLLNNTKSVYQTSYDPPTTSNSNTGTGKLNCNVVYPDFMNYQDMQYDKNDKASPNRLRCAYARQCNVSWSSACPDRG